MGIAPRWDTTYTDASLRDEILLSVNKITSAGHQYASPPPRLWTGCPDRSIKTQTHEPSLSLFQVSLEKDIVGGEKEIFGEDIVRPRTDFPDPSTPLRMFLTLEVSAGVFGGAPSVKEADEIREREDIEEDSGLCFAMLCPVMGDGALIRSGIGREGVGVGNVSWRVGESGSSSEDNSLRSRSNPVAVEGSGRLVPLAFRGESSDFRAFGVG